MLLIFLPSMSPSKENAEIVVAGNVVPGNAENVGNVVPGNAQSARNFSGSSRVYIMRNCAKIHSSYPVLNLVLKSRHNIFLRATIY